MDLATRFQDALEPLASPERGRESIGKAAEFLQPFVERWAREAMSTYVGRPGVELDEFVSEIRLAVIVVLNRVADGAQPIELKSQNWYAYLRQVGRNAAQGWVDSPAATGIAGQAGRMRRRTAIAKHASQLALELGRQPTPNEVLARVNAAAMASRTDAAKQGALVTCVDFEPASAVYATDDLALAAAADEESARLGDPVGSGACERVSLQWMLRECEERGPEVGAFARAWIGGGLANPPMFTSADEARKAIGVSRRRGAVLVDEVRAVAKTLLREAG